MAWRVLAGACIILYFWSAFGRKPSNFCAQWCSNWDWFSQTSRERDCSLQGNVSEEKTSVITMQIYKPKECFTLNLAHNVNTGNLQGGWKFSLKYTHEIFTKFLQSHEIKCHRFPLFLKKKSFSCFILLFSSLSNVGNWMQDLPDRANDLRKSYILSLQNLILQENI